MPAGQGHQRLAPAELVDGVLAGDRARLARAITLVESLRAEHEGEAQEVLDGVLSRAGGAVRVGITGSPGVGKSCLIDALGAQLLEAGHRVAVLAVDPSSSVSGGSILGDKTRMNRLAADPRAFVRPSPAGRSLGGVARRTREAMLLCEAAGHDVVVVETVGVGQSEVAVRSMVDFFLLLLQPGAGDELQGIKRGVVELADGLVVTKADGDSLASARRAREEYAGAIAYLTSPTPGWEVEVAVCSARTGAGVAELWRAIQRHREHCVQTGFLDRRRRAQALEWMHQMISDRLERRFYGHPRVAALLDEVRRAVAAGEMAPGAGALKLLGAAT